MKFITELIWFSIILSVVVAVFLGVGQIAVSLTRLPNIDLVGEGISSSSYRAESPNCGKVHYLRLDETDYESGDVGLPPLEEIANTITETQKK